MAIENGGTKKRRLNDPVTRFPKKKERVLREDIFFFYWALNSTFLATLIPTDWVTADTTFAWFLASYDHYQQASHDHFILDFNHLLGSGPGVAHGFPEMRFPGGEAVVEQFHGVSAKKRRDHFHSHFRFLRFGAFTSLHDQRERSEEEVNQLWGGGEIGNTGRGRCKEMRKSWEMKKKKWKKRMKNLKN